MMDDKRIQDLLPKLQHFGFSEGEAKTFLALAMLKRARASDIAELAGVIHTKVYSYLNTLVERDLAIKHEITGTPNTFEILDIEPNLDRLKPNVSTIISTTVDVVEEGRSRIDASSHDDDQFVRVIQGDLTIRQELKQVPKRVTRNMLVFFHHSYQETIAQFRESYPEITVMTPQNELIKQKAIKQIINMPQFDEIVGKRRVMLIFEDVKPQVPTCEAVDIVAYPEPEIDLDPLMIRITHPVIVQLQFDGIFSLIKLFSSENSPFNQFVN